MSPKDTAYIVERLAVRFMAMVADYERKLVEHRDAFGARTSADAKIIEGLRAAADEQVLSASKVAYVLRCAGETPVQAAQRVVKERDALRAEVADLRGIVDMVHASLGIKRGDHIGKAIEALKSQSTPTTKQHPVNGGEWVRKTTDGLMYKIGDTFRLESYEIKDGQIWCNLDNGASWLMSVCEPCDPPVDHDTPAGKAVAEAVVQDERCGEIAVGDMIEGLFDDTKITVRREPDQNHGSRIVISDANDMGEANIYLTESGARQMATALIGLCDVRKVPQ